MERRLILVLCFGFLAVASALPVEDNETAPSQEENTVTGRGKMKNMGPLMAAGAMKLGMVGIIAFKALALLVGKALLVSKLAFLLAAIIGLKKLFSQQKHVTYEVVAHPHHGHHSEHHGGGGGGGSRTISATKSFKPPVLKEET
ncbi:hypothetical protein GE061_015474 [Apolygus lucorum]|uniref:Transmembrane protein n=1 Tax=Apolygus lucorum TaxID=248454 RepID=A0A8S9XQ46_APOLU|nr:hypothetical protein GE061_015474 [Apolygus lucorum]